MLTVGSLFSGIGGLDLGLERAGLRVIWQSEIEPFCCKVLAKHWPNITNHGDIMEMDWNAIQRPNIICGGFPCQDISTAGRKAGIREGTRSGLWSYFADAIRILRPEYAIIENVSALLIRGIEIVLYDLAQCGYDAEWQMLPASAFGAPHDRKRLFIVAYPQEIRRHTLVFKEFCSKSDTQAWTYTSQGLANSAGYRTALPPSDLCMGDGIPYNVDSIGAYGNAVVPQVAEYVGRCVVAHAKPAHSGASGDGACT